MGRITHYGSLWSRFQTMVDSQIDFAFEFRFHFHARMRSGVPGVPWQTGQLSLKRLVLFCLMFFSKVRHLSVVEDFSLCKIKAYLLKAYKLTPKDTKLKLRQFLCTDKLT